MPRRHGRRLRRGGELRGEGCVAIKRFKPKQDERVDLPSIGLQTVRLLIEQHYRCLAVDAGKTLFFDRPKRWPLPTNITSASSR